MKTVRQIAEELVAREGGGTVAWVTLPLAPGTRAAGEERPS